MEIEVYNLRKVGSSFDWIGLKGISAESADIYGGYRCDDNVP